MAFNLIEALENYSPIDDKEKESLNKIKDFLNNNENCFSRTNLKGHITAGALVIDKEGNVLLNHHKSLDKWLGFGGHSDGESNSLNVAKREVMEESGIVEIDDCGGKIFDVDVHMIPNNPAKKEPEHYHYDIRFLFYVVIFSSLLLEFEVDSASVFLSNKEGFFKYLNNCLNEFA